MDTPHSANSPSPSSASTSRDTIGTSSSTSRKKARLTPVWQFYSERLPISDTHWEVKCLQCPTTYRIKRDGSTGTSTLHKHHRVCSAKNAASTSAIDGSISGAVVGSIGEDGHAGSHSLEGSPAPRMSHQSNEYPQSPLGHPSLSGNGVGGSKVHHPHASTMVNAGFPPGVASSSSLPQAIPAQALHEFLMLRAAHQQQQQQQQHQHGEHGQRSHHATDGQVDVAHTMPGLEGQDFGIAAAAAAAMNFAHTGSSGSSTLAGASTHDHGAASSAAASTSAIVNGVDTIDLLVLNPNSSESINAGLRQMLEPSRDPNVKYSFLTGPSHAPPSINDPPTSIASAQANFEALLHSDVLSVKSGVLVCCFSAHPLVPMIRHQWPSLPCMHILDAAVNHAMSCGAATFGVLTTGRAMVGDIDGGVQAYFGGVSMRYKGCVATGLGVLELGDPGMRRHVEARIRQESARLALDLGAEAIILGCAGE